VTIPPEDRHAEIERVFRLWEAAKNKRDADECLLCLWKLCRPEIERALKDMAMKEHSAVTLWMERRGLSYEEISDAVFPAVKDAAHNFDPEHDSGASFSTFAMGYIRGAVASIAKDSPPLGNSHSIEMERLNEDEVVQALPRNFAEIVAMARRYPVSQIVEAVYQKTKDAGEHPSEKLRRIANRIEEEFSEELEHSAKLQALHSMLIAQSIRAEDHESRMVLVSTLAHLLFIRQERRAKGMPPESYSVKALARVYGKPSPPTLAKWLKACDEQGITAENCTVEEIARIISSKRGPAFRGRLNQ
jgi:hypothetical protein